ncbi:hypothetical protein GCM10007859_13620 [Brevundimonas denitrificans]|uniref:Uncharacterized protein n=1 Tax=Brevundimonas denitrificans TaxID=1443434 RepID=A0ABQ6BI31_9CAUL|nr:hypothetical protein GCM10007859_13620 [Brevundimonas denitrificans]
MQGQQPALPQFDLEGDRIGQVADHGVDGAEPAGRRGHGRGPGTVDDHFGEQAGAGVAAGPGQGLRELAGEVRRDVAQVPGEGVEDVGFEGGVKRDTRATLVVSLSRGERETAHSGEAAVLARSGEGPGAS